MPLLDDDLLLNAGEKGSYYYVEPGVQQVFTYVTKVPESVCYVLAHMTVVSIREKHENADENTFTEERLFAVVAEKADTGELPVSLPGSRDS